MLAHRLRDTARAEPDHCGHASAARLRHELATALHELEPGEEIEHAGGEQRVVLAKAVTGNEARQPTFAQRLVIMQSVDDIEARLRVLCISEIASRILQTQIAH